MGTAALGVTSTAGVSHAAAAAAVSEVMTAALDERDGLPGAIGFQP
jgi:hypothetical protein